MANSSYDFEGLTAQTVPLSHSIDTDKWHSFLDNLPEEVRNPYVSQLLEDSANRLDTLQASNRALSHFDTSTFDASSFLVDTGANWPYSTASSPRYSPQSPLGLQELDCTDEITSSNCYQEPTPSTWTEEEIISIIDQYFQNREEPFPNKVSHTIKGRFRSLEARLEGVHHSYELRLDSLKSELDSLKSNVNNIILQDISTPSICPTQMLPATSDEELQDSMMTFQKAMIQTDPTSAFTRPTLEREARNKPPKMPEILKYRIHNDRLKYHVRLVNDHLCWIPDDLVDPAIALSFWRHNKDIKMKAKSKHTIYNSNKSYYKKHPALWKAISHGDHAFSGGGAV